MKNITFNVLIMVLFSFSLSCKKANTPDAAADQSSFASSAEINKRLGKGVNLGDTFESSYLTPNADPVYFQKIAEAGFKTVRLPVRWEIANRSMYNAPYTISAVFLTEIKSAINEALKNKLHVIINMHHHDSLFANPDVMKPMFIAQWQQIAAYFKNYSDSLLFEVLNEPNNNLDADRWNIFFADALKEIRKTNPNRTVLKGLAEWGGLSALSKLTIPDDKHLILTIHYYNPFHFTHQGAEWVDGSSTWLGTKWYDTEYERQTIEDEFKSAIEFSKEKNIPVNIGEFGAYSKADMESRVRWTRFLARWFEQQNFSWDYWEFNSGFGVYDPATGTFRTLLINALLKDAMTPATTVTLVSLYKSNFSNQQADGWNLYNNDASASSTLTIADNKALVNITSAGSESWHIQLIRHNTAIEAGKMYRIEFNAYSTIQKDIAVLVMQSKDPWGVYGNSNFTINTTDDTYSFTFTAPSTDANCNFVFSLGNNGLAPVTLYNINLQEVKL
ncbi:MAG: cellulase family glycosylhydrolase [Chitinophagaceae bacterium]|nr:cellulase family glycosylhydrolase [Chitinophagaceae bacterium]